MGLTLNPLTGHFDFTSVGSGGSSPATRFTSSFNSTTDWSLSGSEYSLTITQASHGKGVNPNIQVFETAGLNLEEVFVNILINASGDVTLKVNASPDTRFNGVVVII